VDPSDPLPALLAAWRFLGQPAPHPTPADVAAFWHWAPRHWRLDLVPALGRRPVADAIA
jgi:hypothetical protein